MSQEKSTIAVLGAGSWGTAIAKHLSDHGHQVRLWTHRTAQAEEISRSGENARYLPGAKLGADLTATASTKAALDGADLVVSVVPSQVTRAVWDSAKGDLAAKIPIMCASKGIEMSTLCLMSEALAQVLPDHPLAFLAGPSFAKEVAKGVPTAVVIGSTDQALAGRYQRALSSDTLRAYVTHDVIGVEVGGALKNIIAIACGIADGLGFGHNTRAAIITRGLAEITRMAVKLGADPLTLAGLGGMGDLVLTCTGDLSRNRRVGLGLGQGRSLQEILDEMGEVAEGVHTTKAAQALAEREGVDVPITNEMYAIIYEGKSPKQSVLDLMRRGLKHEQN